MKLRKTRKPKFEGTATEHFLVGVGSVLVGRNTARYRVWDAMHAIDYLSSRTEVDPQRIGFTGSSGGGMVTSYVMALDERVTCAAPACYLTTFRHLIDSIGPQDAEQNIFGQIAFGLDHPDYVLLRALRPTLISSTNAAYEAELWRANQPKVQSQFRVTKWSPGLTFHPPAPVDDAYQYLHDDGKQGDSGADGPIEKLIADGYAVVTIDLSGQGETASEKHDPLLTHWKKFYPGLLLGKPLVGIRVEDALAAGNFVACYQKKRDNPRKVHLVGVGQAGIVALHAAALNPDLFASVTLRNTPRSWSSLVAEKRPAGQRDSTVHGALEVYDIPDLVRLVGEDKVRIVE